MVVEKGVARLTMAVLVVHPMSVEDAVTEVYAVNTSSCGANMGL